jgi:hypothetical protein
MLNAAYVQSRMAPRTDLPAHVKMGNKSFKIFAIEQRIGSLSTPSKMPCRGWSTPAHACNVGTQMKNLAEKTGDDSIICGAMSCYARGGMYNFSNVKKALEFRLAAFKRNPTAWTADMIALISLQCGKSGYFRWNDSGDVHGLIHLEAIIEIAKALPKIKFWLPTREYSVLQEYAKKHGNWNLIQYTKDGKAFNGFPKNLIIRGSAFRFNAEPPIILCKGLGIKASGAKAKGYNCPASTQNNECGDCRECWGGKFAIYYKIH